MNRSIALAGAFAPLLVATVAGAYPIQPRTLWSLVWEADLVVVAQVEDVRRQAGREQSWDDSLAVLDVRETWLGDPVPRVEVDFPFGLICPAPPRYEVGKTVIAFLRRNGQRWSTVALSYGTRYVATDDELKELREVVQYTARAQSVLRRIPGAIASGPTKQWAVYAASRRATRWDGLYSIAPAADDRLAYYDPRAHEAERLDANTLDQLAASFVIAPSYDRSLLMMLELLRGHHHPAFDAAAADAIETVLANQAAPYWMDEALDAFEARLGKPKPPPVRPEAAATDPIEEELRRLNADRRSPADPETDDAVQLRWHRLKGAHALQPVKRSDYGRPARMRTGPDTPL